ncbi:hypothetical protein TBK1r_02920 [Stieleria magnilauensis]|uniref:RNA polymerase sigma-70 ECF-like HTH domain-containing protein n=2 Tax=Stieleria magnilauensis TaxID=2527963 RepID=A0ABX5XI00_9BACT|nr:hypothetical protein TBK1r_02920 [Planctomycetes bacterium TBK1r]
MKPEDFDIRLSDGEPDWSKILDVMVTFVRLNRVNDQNRRGAPEDVVQSAIKTTLKTKHRWGEGDIEFYELLWVNAKRKIDTARKHYRNGHGRSVPFSRLSTDEFQFIVSKEDCTVAVATGDVSDGPKSTLEQSEEELVVGRLGMSLNDWLEEEFGDLTEFERAVAKLWMQNYTVDEIAAELGVSASKVKRARSKIRRLLDGQDDEAPSER